MADTAEDPIGTTSGVSLRIAFLLVSLPVFLGAYVLYRARDHLDADAAKIFEAVARAMQQDQERSDP